MLIRPVLGEETANIVSAYAAQTGLEESIKQQFWGREMNSIRGY